VNVFPLLSSGNMISSLTLTCSYTGSVILRIAYGYKAKDRDDPLVHHVEKCVEDLGFILTPGAWIVDFLPICKPNVSYLFISMI
jgi:hypothetical protein